MFSLEQKAIIRKICEEQEGSFLRVAEKYTMKILKELRKEGYNPSIVDITEVVVDKLKQWDEVKKDPDRLCNLLDDQELGMVKHHLVHDFLGNTLTKPIWKKLNILDKANEFKN